MDERVKPLRDAFNEAAAAFADAVSACPDSAWSNVCAPEGWTVAALAHHVAKGHARNAEWIATMTAGQPVRLTEEELDAENAEDAQRFAGATKVKFSCFINATALCCAPYSVPCPVKTSTSVPPSVLRVLCCSR